MATTTKTKKVLRITAKKHGFRRCGVAHSATPTDYDLVRFSKEQLEQLKAEDMLIVHEVDMPVDEDKAAK